MHVCELLGIALSSYLLWLVITDYDTMGRQVTAFAHIMVDEYLGECVGLFFIALYGTVYMIGSKRNESIANTALNQCLELFKSQFSQLGIADGGKAQLLYKESQNKFMFYATGRRYCRGCLMIFDLRSRQDLLSLVLNALFQSSTSDYIALDIPMNDADMECFVFTVLKKSKLPTMQAHMRDLKQLPRLVPLEFLPKSLCCLTDLDELIVHFLPSRIHKIIRQYEHHIEMIHFSDQNVLSSVNTSMYTSKSLHLRFNISNMDVKQELNGLVALSLSLVDMVGEFKVPESTRVRQLQRRQDLKFQVKKPKDL